MDNKNISRRVPCNKKLKEYNVNNLRRIADMSVSEVYNQISASSGIITHKCDVCIKLLTMLISKVNNFIPSEPMTLEDQTKVRQLHSRWLVKLQQQLAEVSKPSMPIYLRDTVTQRLKAMGHDEVCENIQLEWYIGEYNPTTLDPQKIADAIIERKGTVWKEVKPLVKNDFYNIRLHSINGSAANNQGKDAGGSQATDVYSSSSLPTKRNYTKGRNEDIVSTFEFIEAFPSTPGVETLDKRLQADIAVVNQVIAWRKQPTSDYDYKTQFQFYLEQLQTLPDDAKDISFATLDSKTRKKLVKAGGASQTAKKRTKKEKVDDETNIEDSAIGSETLSHEKSIENTTSFAESNLSSVGESTPPEINLETHNDDEQFAKNYEELMKFMREESKHLRFGEEIDKPDHIMNLKKFAGRPDYDKIYSILKENIGKCTKLSQVMQYVRNVVRENQTIWSTESVRK